MKNIWRRCPSNRLRATNLVARVASGVSQSIADDIFEAVAGNNASLAVTEAKDTTALSAQVRVSASLTATEAKDTSNISAKTILSASLAVTEAKDAIALSTKAIVSGSLAVTDIKDTAALAAKAIVSANVSAAEIQDALTAAAKVLISCGLSANDTADILAAAAKVIVSSELSTAEATDILTAITSVIVSARLDTASPADSVEIQATVEGEQQEINCALDAVEGKDICNVQIKTVVEAGGGAAFGWLSFWQEERSARLSIKENKDGAKLFVKRVKLTNAIIKTSEAQDYTIIDAVGFDVVAEAERILKEDKLKREQEEMLNLLMLI